MIRRIWESAKCGGGVLAGCFHFYPRRVRCTLLRRTFAHSKVETHFRESEFQLTYRSHSRTNCRPALRQGRIPRMAKPSGTATYASTALCPPCTTHGPYRWRSCRAARKYTARLRGARAMANFGIVPSTRSLTGCPSGVRATARFSKMRTGRGTLESIFVIRY